MPSRYPGSCRIKWDLGTLFFLSIHLPADLQQWKHLPCEDKGDKLKQTNTKKKNPFSSPNLPSKQDTLQFFFK